MSLLRYSLASGSTIENHQSKIANTRLLLHLDIELSGPRHSMLEPG